MISNMKRRYALCLLFAITFILSESAAAKFTAAEINNKYKKSIVMIYSVDSDESYSLGSGFIVKANGVIVTNFHVIYNAQTILVKSFSGQAFKDVKVLGYDVQKDIAVLKINGKGMPVIPLGTLKDAAVGEAVVVIGSPEGLDNSVSVGVLSSKRDSGEGYKYLQTDASVSHGSSGSPLISESGKAIGVVSFFLSEGQNLNFAIPSDYVTPLINDESKISFNTFYNNTSGKYDDLYGGNEDNGESQQVNESDTTDMFNEGYEYYLKMDYLNAINKYLLVPQKDARYVHALFNIGLAYYNLQDYNNAISYHERVRELAPYYTNINLVLGMDYLVAKNEDKAISLLNEYVKKDTSTDKGDAYCGLGTAYSAKAYHYAGLNNYQQALYNTRNAYNSYVSAISNNSKQCDYKKRDTAEYLYDTIAVANMQYLCTGQTGNGYFTAFATQNNALGYGSGDYAYIQQTYKNCKQNDKINCEPLICHGLYSSNCVTYTVTNNNYDYTATGYAWNAAFSAFQQCFKNHPTHVNACTFKRIAAALICW